jgi:hypothetical protein
MNGCDLDVVLYFYDEMEPADRARATAHLSGCAECRQKLEELDAIRRALAARPVVDAPPAGDWSGFMRRLDDGVRAGRPAKAAPRRMGIRELAAFAAMLALVTIGVVTAGRFRAATTTAPAAPTQSEAPSAVAAAPASAVAAAPASADQSLRQVSAEHLERSKLVVLGLATRDARSTTADDWQYERRLAETLLSDTRLYRIAAQDRGVSDVARVMRDLETVLLEASLSDSSDKGALERVQRLITKRDLVVKMQVMTGSAGL